MSEEEYCIWHPWIGRMDTSTDWEKLYKLCEEHNWIYNYSRLSIIPTRLVGKKGYRTIKQLQEESEKLFREAITK